MSRDSGEVVDGGAVQVLARSAKILDCMSAATPRLRAWEIREATGLPATTVARILRTLLGEGLLQRQGPYYSIGLRVTVWSSAATASSDLVAVADPLVGQLRDDCGESAGLYIRAGNNRLSVLRKEATHAIAYRGTWGQVMSLHAGAAGKVFMAHDPEALQAALEGGLVAYTARTVTDLAALDQQLETIRRQGWSYVEEEREVGLNSLAAPVFGSDGQVAAAVAIAGPSFRLTSATAPGLGRLVAQCAREISRGLLWPHESQAQ